MGALLTATDERLVRAAAALLTVADHQIDKTELPPIIAELRAVATLLEEREWLKTLPGGTPEDAA